MKKDIKLYENHTIITKSWRKVIFTIITKIPLFALLMLIFLFYIPTGLLWIVSLGHISSVSVINYSFFYLGGIVFGDTSDNMFKIRLFVGEGIATKSWLRGAKNTIFAFIFFGLFPLYIITAIIWLLSLGHLHLYRLVNQIYDYIMQD